jgi:hypothetical protein
MHKAVKLIFVIIVIFLFSACDIDPYKGKRPIDYPNSSWKCNESLLTFSVDDKGFINDALLDSKGTLIPVDFLWSSLDASVIVYRTDGNQESLFSGENTFGKQIFTMKIENTNGYFTESAISLSCKRMSS